MFGYYSHIFGEQKNDVTSLEHAPPRVSSQVLQNDDAISCDHVKPVNVLNTLKDIRGMSNETSAEVDSLRLKKLATFDPHEAAGQCFRRLLCQQGYSR